LFCPGGADPEGFTLLWVLPLLSVLPVQDPPVVCPPLFVQIGEIAAEALLDSDDITANIIAAATTAIANVFTFCMCFIIYETIEKGYWTFYYYNPIPGEIPVIILQRRSGSGGSGESGR
jgi:hypothetical protein